MSVRKVLLVLSAWVLLATCAMPAFAAPPPSPESRPGDLIVLRAGKTNAFTHVPRSQPLAEAPHIAAAPTATINVSYNGFTPAVQAAVQYAVDIWETQITSSVPIQVNANWTPLSGSALGNAGTSAWYRNFTGAPLTNTWYPAALANARRGSDLDPSKPDITMNLNSTYSNWYLGTDGKTPASTYDLVSVVLHEIGHGLGVSGSMTITNGQGKWGLGTTTVSPVMYDRFTENGAGIDLIDTTVFPNPSAELAAQLQSGNIYFFGPNAVAANGGSRPMLYAPPIWQQGSSYSHLDEEFFGPGNPNSLMTPVLNWAESIHDPGPITRGILKDLGWTIAGAGALDLSFGETPLIGPGTQVATSIIQPDGKILIGGEFTTVNGVSRSYIARLNSDGVLDSTFVPGSGPNGPVEALALQADGKILMAGIFYSVNGVSRRGIARLNADGSLDTTFAPAGGPDSYYVYAVGVQADGKIVIGGSFSAVNGVSRRGIARLNADGSLDTTFAPAGGTNGSVYALVPQSGGKIIIGGDFSTVNGVNQSGMARLNVDGSLDTTFAPNGGTNSGVEVLTAQADGKILMGGWFTTVNGVNRPYLARLNPDGSLDTTFLSTNITNHGVLGIAVQADGKIVIGGYFTTVNGASRNRIARLNPDGSLDTAFAPSGVDSDVYAVAVQADGKIIIGGKFSAVNTTSRSTIARLQANGSLDTTFSTRNNSPSDVYELGVQPDGKILVGGGFFYANGSVQRGHIARLNANGSLDPTFAATLDNKYARVYAVAVQADGKIVIGGWFYSVNGMSRRGIARLNANGSLDTTFAPPFNIDVHALALQPDGKIVVGGYFSDSSRSAIVRLNADGSQDTSFGPTDAGTDNRIKTVALQPDGKIIIGGEFTMINGVSRNKIARLNANGSLDTTFAPNGGADRVVESVVLQPDGKILIGGHFSSVNGVTRYCIARLNVDGSLDTTFAPGITSPAVLTLALQSDGKIVIGGLLDSVYIVYRFRVARLNANGSLVTAFDPPSGGDGRAYAVALQADGNILMGGNFTLDHSIVRTSVVRLLK